MHFVDKKWSLLKLSQDYEFKHNVLPNLCYQKVIFVYFTSLYILKFNTRFVSHVCHFQTRY